MTIEQYTVLAYAAGLGLLAVYALALWLGHRSIDRRQSR
jgi:NhaP-type Na+/H+ and K+/H+ antiporter